MIRLAVLLVLRAVLLVLRGAYGTPTDPVSTTVITVAFAVANFLDPIRALRAFTGGSDPPGSGYVVTSDSTSATSWKTIATAISSAVASVLATNGAIFNNNVGIAMKDSGGTQRSVSFVDVVNQLWYGNASLATVLTGASLKWWNGSTLEDIWRSGNDGTGSGLDADTVDGAHLSQLVRNDAASDLGNTIALRGKESGGTARNLAQVNGSNVVVVGDVANALQLQGTALTLFNGGVRTIWRDDNDGPGSGLDADTVDGVQEAALAKLASSPAFTGTVQGTRLISTQATGTAPLTVTSTTKVANLNADRLDDLEATDFATSGHTHSNPANMGVVVSGSYSGNSSYPRNITGLGITPKFVIVQQVTGTTKMGMLLGHDAFVLLSGGFPGAFSGSGLASGQFTIPSGSGLNDSGQTYNYVAIG